MAKILFGQGVAKMSGKLGGSVYASNRYGAYVRNWAKPVNQQTEYQVEARELITTLSQEWRTLSSLQQGAWRTWADTHPVIDRLGNSITLTGLQAFIRINSIRAICAIATSRAEVPGAPSFLQSPFTTTFSTLDYTTDKMEIDAAVTIPAGSVFMFHVSPPVSPGKNYTYDIEKFLVYKTNVAEVLADAVYTNLWTDYLARFGSQLGNVGRKYVCRAFQVDDGVVGPAIIIDGILTAS